MLGVVIQQGVGGGAHGRVGIGGGRLGVIAQEGWGEQAGRHGGEGHQCQAARLGIGIGEEAEQAWGERGIGELRRRAQPGVARR